MCIKEVKITRIAYDRKEGTAFCREIFDAVISEEPVSIYLNGEFFCRAVCLPKDMKELAVGHLVSEGVLAGKEDLRELEIKEEGIFAEVRLKGKKQPLSRISVKAEDIFAAAEDLYKHSALFRETGMVHSAALYDIERDKQYFGEDISRHNAVDKALGMAVLDGAVLAKSCLLTSGRMPADMVRKAVNAQIPVMISRSGPTAEAINMAKEADITLAGFVRDGRMNIYTREDRIGENICELESFD